MLTERSRYQSFTRTLLWYTRCFTLVYQDAQKAKVLFQNKFHAGTSAVKVYSRAQLSPKAEDSRGDVMHLK